MKIYNLFPLLAGPLPHWESHIDRAAAMEFDWLFVNPIQQPGSSGSLYSIADYFAINPSLIDPGSTDSPEEQVQKMVQFAARRGMKVMIDLVINHCAADSTLVPTHPEWFVHETDGRVAHPFCIEDGTKVVWRDLARFDHEHTSDPEGQYRYFLDIVKYLLGLGFQGFRCDAAYQVPGRLWHRLTQDVKKEHPETVFAAETLGCTADQTKRTAHAGFDYVFNSSKWWDFGSTWLMEQYDLVRETAPSISFPESHDTARLFAEMHGNENALKQRFLFAALFAAGVMIPVGFEFGFRNALHVVSTRPSDWEDAHVDLRGYIRSLNQTKSQFSVFNEDCPTNIIAVDNPAVLLMWKGSTTTAEEALILLNKDPWNRQYFHAGNLGDYVQAGAPLVDLSPENKMEFIPVPFSYELAPGEGRVFVTARDP